MRAAATASWQGMPTARHAPDARPLLSPPTGPVARELIAAKYDVAAHTSEGVTPAYLRSREKALLRELTPIENELKAVRRRLAALSNPL